MDTQNNGLKMNIGAGRAFLGDEPTELEQCILSEFSKAELQEIANLLAKNPILLRYFILFTDTSERLYLKHLAEQMEKGCNPNATVNIAGIIAAFRKASEVS